jgi:hypothetical protein
MYAIVNSRTQEGLTKNNQITSIVSDLLVFKYEINAIKYLNSLRSSSYNFSAFIVIELRLPSGFITYKYFGD